MNKFHVEVEGKARATFDAADEAVRWAMGHVYLSPAQFQVAVDTVKQGQVYSYCYGFAGVNIVPVAATGSTMTDDQALTIAVDAALDAGCAVIQTHLGVTTGDFAGMYFSGHSDSGPVRAVLSDYFIAQRKDAEA